MNEKILNKEHFYKNSVFDSCDVNSSKKLIKNTILIFSLKKKNFYNDTLSKKQYSFKNIFLCKFLSNKNMRYIQIYAMENSYQNMTLEQES